MPKCSALRCRLIAFHSPSWRTTMKRSKELTKFILTEIAASAGVMPLMLLFSYRVQAYGSPFKGTTLPTVVDHLMALKEDGLIECETFYEGAISGNVTGLTLKGREYLDSLR